MRKKVGLKFNNFNVEKKTRKKTKFKVLSRKESTCEGTTLSIFRRFYSSVQIPLAPDRNYQISREELCEEKEKETVKNQSVIMHDDQSCKSLEFYVKSMLANIRSLILWILRLKYEADVDENSE